MGKKCRFMMELNHPTNMIQFIFTFIMLICTLKSTIAFFFLFFTLDIAFLMLALAYYYPTAAGGANVGFNTAGGVFGILAAFAAWQVYKLSCRPM